MAKRIVVVGFAVGLGTFLLHQTMVKFPNELSSPDGSANNELTKPVQTVIRQEKPVPTGNPGNPAENLLPQLEAALLAYDVVDDQSFLVLLAELVRNDPAAAARFAESVPAGAMREEVLRRVAQYWTAQDPVSAEAWAAKLADDNERRSVLSDVCFEVAQARAAQAVQMAEQHDLGTMPGQVLENLVQQWAAQDFSSAAAWIEKRPFGEQRDEMFRRLALVQSETAPADAARLVVEQIAPGPIQDEAAVSVVYKWAMRDIAGATAWVDLFPPSPLRERANHELVSIARSMNSTH